jgi:hypothetical protein
MGARWPVRSSASSWVPTSKHLEDAFTFLQEDNNNVKISAPYWSCPSQTENMTSIVLDESSHATSISTHPRKSAHLAHVEKLYYWELARGHPLTVLGVRHRTRVVQMTFILLLELYTP